MLSHWAGMLESLGQAIVAAVGLEVACSGEGGRRHQSSAHMHKWRSSQYTVRPLQHTVPSLNIRALGTHECADTPLFQVDIVAQPMTSPPRPHHSRMHVYPVSK